MNMRNCINRALAGAAPALLASVFLTSPALGAGFTANLVTPPVSWDGGNAYGGGANNGIALPQQGGTPGIASLTMCIGGANDGNLPCSSNADCTPTCVAGSCANNFLTNNGGPCTSNSDCQGAAGVCRDATGSDGITAGDSPTLATPLNGLKSTCNVNNTAVAASVTFVSNGVSTPLGNGTGTGHCQGGHICNNTGPKANNTCLAGPLKKAGCLADYTCTCKKNSDCGKDSNGFAGTCIDGNEYILEVDGIIGSNPDNSPSCTGQACRVGSGGACVKGKCVGGPNAGGTCTGFSNCNNPGANCLAGKCSNGQSVCQTDSQCQGGTCQLPAVTETGDEVAFNFGPVKALLNCPLAFRLDFPMEANKGKGSVKSDVAKTALGVVDPSGTNASVTKCALHEPGASNVTELGFFAGTSPEVIEGAVTPPAPGLLLPLAGSTLGQAINSGHGPVIGISGGKVK